MEVKNLKEENAELREDNDKLLSYLDTLTAEKKQLEAAAQGKTSCLQRYGSFWAYEVFRLTCRVILAFIVIGTFFSAVHGSYLRAQSGQIYFGLFQGLPDRSKITWNISHTHETSQDREIARLKLHRTKFVMLHDRHICVLVYYSKPWQIMRFVSGFCKWSWVVHYILIKPK